MKTEIYPSNKKHYNELIKFGKKIIEICKKEKINPIIYGSYMLFHFTQDPSLKVKDLDFYINEEDFPKLIESLNKNKIKHKYSKKYHTLQVFKENLKIEFDSIDFWNNRPINPISLNLGNKKIKALDIKSLKYIYKKASLKSKDDPLKNLKKYKSLNKIQ
jgi:hypothetical protein